MAVSKEALLHAIETSYIVFPAIPGESETLTIAGVEGRWSPLVSHPFINLVGVATLDNNNVDATIKQVYEFFSREGRAFGWLVGSESTPEDLGAHLEAAGLALAYSAAGMALTDMNLPIKTNPAVTVRKATTADRSDVVRLHSDAYPVPRQVAEISVSLVDAVDAIHYLAFIEGVEAPISVATMYYMAHAPIVAMQGAATLPNYRGRGIYTALMARRLADARGDGMEAAIMQADRTTSAPICAKLGFSEVSSANVYAWMPETGH